MLAARGVSLGLGKINLSDLNSLPRGSRQAALARQRRERTAVMAKDDKPKLVVKKRVDKQVSHSSDRPSLIASDGRTRRRARRFSLVRLSSQNSGQLLPFMRL